MDNRSRSCFGRVNGSLRKFNGCRQTLKRYQRYNGENRNMDNSWWGDNQLSRYIANEEKRKIRAVRFSLPDKDSLFYNDEDISENVMKNPKEIISFGEYMDKKFRETRLNPNKETPKFVDMIKEYESSRSNLAFQTTEGKTGLFNGFSCHIRKLSPRTNTERKLLRRKRFKLNN
ncbi:hypothetical protein ACOME3_009303 [Neoechinorhynchus agilis]